MSLCTVLTIENSRINNKTGELAGSLRLSRVDICTTLLADQLDLIIMKITSGGQGHVINKEH